MGWTISGASVPSGREAVRDLLDSVILIDHSTAWPRDGNPMRVETPYRI